MKKTILIIITITAAAITLAMTQYPSLAQKLSTSDRKDTFKYKVTVEIETPEGIKTGSAVRELTVIRPEQERGADDTRTFVEGEAVAINLGNGGILFVLLENSGDHKMVFNSLPGPPGLTPEGMKYYKSIKNKKAVVSLKDYPRLVRFKDINDPKSVQLVYETEEYEEREPTGYYVKQRKIIHDNFEEFFGKGVKLKQITVETTEEPIQWRISKWLPWLDQYYAQRLDGDKSSSFAVNAPLANQLSSSYFSTGDIIHE